MPRFHKHYIEQIRGLKNKVLPEGGSDGDVPIKQSDGTIDWGPQIRGVGGGGLSQPLESGFDNRTDSTMSFDEVTRTFTITPVGSFRYTNGGEEYIKSSTESVVITDTSGIHLIYYDGSTLSESDSLSTEEIIFEFTLVAVVYWNSVEQKAILFGEERHGNIMDWNTHLYNHETVGVRYGNGLQVADVTVNSSGNNDTSAQISVGNGVIWDEDIELAISALSFPAQCPILYRDGAVWNSISPTGFLSTVTGSGRGAWNENVGGVWQLSEVANNDFFLSHLYATNDPDRPYVIIVGQAEYPTLGQARDGAPVELLQLDLFGLPSPELKAVASFILQTSNSYNNTVKARVRSTDDGDDYIDWRFVNTGVIASVQSASGNNYELVKAKGSVQGVSYSNTENPISWNPTVIGGTNNVTVSGSVITVLASGTYKFTTTLRTINTNRTELFIRTYIDTVQDTSEVVSNYVSRDTDQNTGGISLITALELTSGQTIEFRGFGDCDGNCTGLDDGTVLLVERVD